LSLDPLHDQVARLALALPTAGDLALAGGGAMVAHNFVVRPTYDVDLEIDGTHVAGLRFTDPRAQALLHILLMFRLQPNGFTTATYAPCSPNTCPGHPPSSPWARSPTTCARLREHGLIARLPQDRRSHQLGETG
jgi:hypothetical protein